MEPFRDNDELIAELQALRPTPRQEFTAELDERAAAAFPRRSWLTGSPLGHSFARLRAAHPRRLVLSAGAAALAAVAVATVVVATNETGSGDQSSSHYLAPLYGESAVQEPSRPQGASSDAHPRRTRSGPARPTGGEGSTNLEFESAVPTVVGHAGTPAGGSLASGVAGTGSIAASSTGPFASKAGHRDVERSAEMVLGADPDEVAGDAAQVFDAVHAANGIVLRSSVSGGAAGDAGARFDLLIPSAKLGDALAAFSAIDVVVSRHEASDDITAPTVGVGEHLRDSRATIDGLLVQLAGASTDAERAEVEAELRTERRHTAALRAQAAKLDRRANLSRVSLRIETSAAATSSDGSGWGIGNALGDAGHILGIAAGVTIVGLAILGPIALIALLAWLANHARRRRARERALT